MAATRESNQCCYPLRLAEESRPREVKQPARVTQQVVQVDVHPARLTSETVTFTTSSNSFWAEDEQSGQFIQNTGQGGDWSW